MTIGREMPDCLKGWKAAQELADWHKLYEKKSPVKISQAFRQLEKKDRAEQVSTELVW